MTGYERITSALNGQMPDTTPIMLHNFMMAVKEAGYTMKEYRDNPEIIAKCYIDAIDRYHYDGILVDIDTVTLAGACGVEIDFPENEPARSHKGILSSISDLSPLKNVNLSDYKYVRNWCEAVKILKEHYKGELYIRGNCDQAPFSLATMLRGTENMMMDLCLEESSKIHALLEYCTDITCQMLTLMSEAGADMLSNGDSPAGPAMLSPDMYREFALPYEKRVVEHSHKLGLPYLLHICGNTDLILEDMVETKADLLELDYLTDINKIAKLFEEKQVGFIGNIDPSGVLALGSVEEVEQKTIELMEVFKTNPRFILNAGCAIPSSTPPCNLEAMIRTARNFKR